jgi:hypothetical protein
MGDLWEIQGQHVIVRHDGLVRYPVPIKLRTSCSVDITFFPFDLQFCFIRFASWLYDSTLVTFNMIKENDSQLSSSSTIKGDIDLTEYVDNSGWILLNSSVITGKL